jgi:hypothetical protein
METKRGWWSLEFGGVDALSARDFDHISDLVSNGFTSGELVQECAGLSAGLLADLIATCFEGGSTHWLESASPLSTITEVKPWYSDPAFYGPDFAIRLTDDDGDTHVLAWESAVKGYALLPPRRLQEIADEQWDAETADVFLQLALFGEVVYD